MPPGSVSVNVPPVMLLARIVSLNVAVATVPTLWPPVPFAGVLAVIVGGAVSGVTLRSMSPWISVAVSARL